MTAVKMPTRPGTFMRRAPGWEQHGWTSIPNALARDESVDWDAKGGYLWIASHQELIFELDAEMLAAAGPRGRDHAYEMLRHLEWHGWLTRTRYRATDGKGTVHIWTLHPMPVPVAERTWKPNKADRRKGYTAPDGTKVAPELLDGQEFQPPRKFPQVTPEVLDGQELQGSEAPGIPDRSGTDRSGIPYMDEKPMEENHGGEGLPAHVTSASDAAEQPPAPLLKADWTNRSTWFCSEHLALVAEDPGADIPGCPRCRRVKDWGLAKEAEAAAAAPPSPEEAEAALEQACPWHDEYGFAIDPGTGAPFEAPAVKCDHRTPPVQIVSQRLLVEDPPAGELAPKGRALYRELFPKPCAPAGRDTPAPAKEAESVTR
jgi:hypothetical protein